MKLKDIPRVEILRTHDEIIIPCAKGQIEEINAFLRSVDEISESSQYIVKIEKKRRKRSLDANAYMWTLIKQLADKLNISHIACYRSFVKDYGVYEVVPIRNDAAKKWCQVWKGNGEGWLTENLGKSRITGYQNIKCYYGSSVYNSKEMSRLLEAVVEECNSQGIETMTPLERNKLYEMYKYSKRRQNEHSNFDR